MILYCSPICPYSHQVRFVWHEKGIHGDIRFIDSQNPPPELAELNPYGDTPTLVDRELVLYEPKIIIEYLDERYPHPPLYPLEPMARAHTRMVIHRIHRDWYRLLEEIQRSQEKKAAQLRTQLQEELIAAAPLFAAKPYFLSDEFSLIDCVLAPLLWRLPWLGLEFSQTPRPIFDYAQRLFSRPSFRRSLSGPEKEMFESPQRLSA
ncbi:stringent starvation protein SspA [Methylothermus subterraneus]